MQKIIDDEDQKEDVQEEEVEFHPIDLLKDHGIN